MLQTQIYGRVSSTPFNLKEAVFALYPNQTGLTQHFANNSKLNESLYYAIDIRHASHEVVSQVENDHLVVICIGYSFHHAHLAQTIATVYSIKGAQGIRDTQGYFNALIIDKKNKTLYLSGDAAGLCPVYYSHDHADLVFSNTLKTILLNSTGQPSINLNVMCELFYVGMVTPPDTLIQGIQSIPCAQYLQFNPQIKLVDFMSPVSQPTVYDKEKLCELLNNSIRPVANYSSLGVMCSGGLDSSLILATLRKNTDHKIDLFTLYYDKQHTDVLNTRLLGKQYDANNHYFKQNNDAFLSAILESLWLVESEAVGTLSSNLALELLFARFMANSSKEIILSGHTHFVKADNSPALNFYKRVYGLFANSNPASYKRRLISPKFGYLACLKKYHQDKNLYFPEVLSARLTGKLSLNLTSSQKYHFPFFDNAFLSYIEQLRDSTANFDYRLLLKQLASNRRLISYDILLTKKSWMPSWIENNAIESLLASIIKRITRSDSFCSSIFGGEVKNMMEVEYKQLNNYRLVMSLFYLELFNEKFIENPKGLLINHACEQQGAICV